MALFAIKNEYLKYKELMVLFGVTRSTIWMWVNNEAMDFPQPFKVGRKLLWKRSEIEAYLESTRKRGRIALYRYFIL
ncbi:MAG: helix-turn-helix domain-containing protein [Holosporaceae bacterium]|nr:helix-turn-helix domain-containing protein [Holosporaceae bacterium]